MATLDVLTLDEAKTALGLGATQPPDEPLLATWVTAVSQRLDTLVGPVVKRTVAGELHDGGVRSVFLKLYPVITVTAVTEYSGTTATQLTAQSPGYAPAEAYATEPFSLRLFNADGTPLDLLGNQLHRRRGNHDTRFAPGRRNVLVDYIAGRFDATANVDERYKRAAVLMLLNLWRSQQDGVSQNGEFDIPQSIYPAFAVPNVVTELFPGELHDPRFLVA